MRVLALGSNYEPIGLISWKKAITLIFLDKVYTLEEYDEEIRSASKSMKIPSVIVMKGGKKRTVNSNRFCRKNVWLRDEGCCQYCGRDTSIDDFTVDHVTPKSNGGKTSWENIVVSCYNCNQKKGQKTLKDCGMRLLKQPVKPNFLPFIADVSGYYNNNSIHPTWKFWLNR